MSEKLGIERNDNNGIKSYRGDFADLPPAFIEKMNGLRFGNSFHRNWIVELLFVTGPGNALIFHAGKFSRSPRDWSQMLHWKIESGVAVKLPVSRVARIASLCAPDLAA